MRRRASAYPGNAAEVRPGERACGNGEGDAIHARPSASRDLIFVRHGATAPNLAGIALRWRSRPPARGGRPATRRLQAAERIAALGIRRSA